MRRVGELADELGRLIAAATTDTSWGLAWTYDGFGNRLAQSVTKGTAPTVSLSVNAATNRISTQGFSYDAAGNLTAWPVGNNTATASYNHENQMTTATTTLGQEWYSYTVAGQRVLFGRSGAAGRIHFYGLRGELLGVYTLGTRSNGVNYISGIVSTRVWLGGLLVASGGNSITQDQLRSVVASGTETLSYYPYGEQRAGQTAVNDRKKFATYTRDENTRLDYAQARYYSSTWGEVYERRSVSGERRAGESAGVEPVCVCAGGSGELVRSRKADGSSAGIWLLPG